MLGLEFTADTWIILLKIIAIDIVLSGDNAVVIAMATRTLPRSQQNKAIMLGTGGAVILRILFAIVIVYLLQIPFVHLIGGLLLLYIAYHVLVEEEEEANVSSSKSLGKAVMTIITADAVMSLDNVVAIAGAADGHILMIAIGVMVSIPIMIFGSKIIVHALERYTWISYIGAGILAWTAGEMIVGDEFIAGLIDFTQKSMSTGIIALITIGLLLLGYLKNKK